MTRVYLILAFSAVSKIFPKLSVMLLVIGVFIYEYLKGGKE